MVMFFPLVLFSLISQFKLSSVCNNETKAKYKASSHPIIAILNPRADRTYDGLTSQTRL